MKRGAALAILAGTALGAPRIARAQSAGTTVRVGIPPSADVAPILYAQKAGLFQKAGLSVDLQTLRSGSVIATAVAGGTLQVGFSSLQAIISGHLHGLGFQLIAPGGVYVESDPYAYMVVRSDAPIKTAKDLNGKTLAAPALKDLDWVASMAFIEKNGGDPSSVKFIELPNPSLQPALVDGRVDAYTVGEPWVQLALDSGKVKPLGKAFSAIAPRFLMTGYFTTADYTNANRETLLKFERVLQDAMRYASAHKSEMIPLLAEVTKQPADLLARTVKGIDVETIEAKDVQPMIDVSARFGVIPKAFPASELISPAALKS